MDPIPTFSVASTAINYLDFVAAQRDESEAIPIDTSFLDQLQSWGAIKDGDLSYNISVYDLTRDGEVIRRGCDYLRNQAAFMSQLPELSFSQTRIYLIDLDSFQNLSDTKFAKFVPMNISDHIQMHQRSPGNNLLGPGKLIYEEGEEMSPPGFETIQARTFDVWNLQSLWQPGMTNKENTNHFCLQTNVLESLLRNPSSLAESPDQSRIVLFFGRYTIEFWQCLSSVRTKFLSDGRVEGKCWSYLWIKLVTANSQVLLSMSSNCFQRH